MQFISVRRISILIFFLLSLLFSTIPVVVAADTSAPTIPGVDYTKPGPSPSPSPSPSYMLNAPSTRRRRALSVPGLGVGASGNNQGYSSEQGKVKLGF
jgi:hypothetical protein